ncbi:MAG: cell division protein FtsZ, partial [Kiloniellales bacterium]
MTLNLNLPKVEHLSARITVIGVGGAGGNAINNMIQSNLEGVEFLVANTDAQALAQSLCERHIQLGCNITQGLGAGSRPDVGRAAAEEALDEIMAELEGTNMIFITAGLGGGTGTGAAPVIARAARDAGILTVGVVTKPFHFEGVHRMRMAESGLSELQEYVDTLIIIPNQNLFRVANEKTTFADAFKMADDVLYSGVRGVTDLMVMPGLVNLDFNDIRSVMTEMGKAMMGTGEASGEGRAIEAAEAAISNPLLDDVSMKGARGVLINISGSQDLTLFEVDAAANRIREEVDAEANIIFGSTFDTSLDGMIRVSVVATGIDADAAAMPRPVTLSLVSSRARPVLQTEADEEEPLVLDSEAPEEIPDEVVAEAAQSQPQAAAEPARFDEDPMQAPAGRAMAAGDEHGTVRAQSGQGAEEQSDGEAPQARELRGAFIAPPPLRPAATPRAESRREAEPFAAAALANASRDRGQSAEPEALRPRKPRGIFARMTGAAAARAVSLAESMTEPVMGHAEPLTDSRPERRAESRAEARPEPAMT